MDDPPRTVADAHVDARGLLCPLPVLRLRKRLLAVADGTVVRLIASDPASLVDVPHFCTEAGHALISARDDGVTFHYWVRRGTRDRASGLY